MKYLLLSAVLLLTAFTTETNQKSNPSKIQIALLLDTSNSMDGLIEQAKGKLWSIVNEFSRYEKGTEPPQLEIALFEYGNDGLSRYENWIRQISAFTTDLDFISEKLFELRTNGGSEYCGTVIHEANQKLEWSRINDDLKLIFIAGNEIFNQGKFNYREACSESVGKDIAINTIFCGDYEQGIRELWKEGATLGKGKYLNIDQNKELSYIETPYDEEIQQLNYQLNNTYIWYGSEGSNKKANQSVQDKNASSYSRSNLVERAVSKISKIYSNDKWDAVDAIEKGTIEAEELAEEENLAPELKGKSAEEIEQYLTDKKRERSEISKKIADLNIKRMAYIEKNSSEEENTLDAAIKRAVADLAKHKGYKLK